MGSQQKQGRLMIIMALVNAPSLHNVIFSGKYRDVIVHSTNATIPLQLNLSIKLHVAVQLCQAVMFMHTRNTPITHLDTKPSNIMVSGCSYTSVKIIKMK